MTSLPPASVPPLTSMPPGRTSPDIAAARVLVDLALQVRELRDSFETRLAALEAIVAATLKETPK